MVVNHADIAIIGGGIQGLFVAYYAKQRYPGAQVSLFEAGIPGHGITAYSAHLHIPYGAGDKYVLTQQSMALLKDLRQQHPTIPIVEMAFCGVCRPENSSPILAQLTQPASVADPFGYPYGDLLAGYCMLSNMTCYVSKRQLVHFLVELISALGVTVYEGVAIQSIERHHDQLLLSRSGGGTFTASVVFSCTGKALLPTLQHLGLPVRTKKVVALHLDHPLPANAPVYYYFDDDAFLLPQPYYCRSLFSFRCEAWDTADPSALVITDADLSTGRQLLEKYAQGLSAYLSGGQVYLDLYNSPSSSPVSCEVESNHFVIGATGGSGVRLAPALAVNALNQLTL